MSFSHEKLNVYQKGLEHFTSIQALLSSWNKHHAFVDHLNRASESILFNLAEATRLRKGAKKLLTLDYAVGSTCECAACLDIAMLKGLLDGDAGCAHKRHLLEICKMLIGLRNSWTNMSIAEGRTDYEVREDGQSETDVFHHEVLDMYKVMLQCYGWLVSTDSCQKLGSRFDRSVDHLATCILLNIAEGNGRYAELSQQSFLDTANAATAKLAVYLDVGCRRAIWKMSDIEHAKGLLLRVAHMTARKNYLD